MSAANLKAIPSKPPKAKQISTRRLELNGELAGHWVEITVEITGRQTIALLRAKEDSASALEVMAERVVEHSFGGDILDQPLSVIVALMEADTKARQDEALDPTSADN